MQPHRWSTMHRAPPFTPTQQYGTLVDPSLYRNLRNSYDGDFAKSEDEIDSSPSPPERVGHCARAFADHTPITYAFPSSAVQSRWRGDRNLTPEYTPSPNDDINQQANSPFYTPREDYHPRQYSGGNCFENSNSTVNSFGSHYETRIEDPQTSSYNHAPVGKALHKFRAPRLRPVSELPDKFRSVFKFGVFNAIQSICFDAVLHSSMNMVISAPTGSGKTVLFELGIIRMVVNPSSSNLAVKCVYVAPTKALCTEKHKEWTSKFSGLGIHCCELTGDTVIFGKGVWGDAKNAQIIVTTAEKWDSLTRNWDDHSRILSQIKLFLVDEVHILNESRGSTLEVVVSRMKTRGSDVRFILVSATVPNIEDVANWIGSNRGSSDPAQIYQFGDEYRPCKLSRFVYGIPKAKGQNDFAYAHTLDGRLFSILQCHTVDKPILVFCPTRKGTIATAKQLAKEYEGAIKENQQPPWSRPLHMDQTFHDKDLFQLASLGIGVHHAGLTIDDRKTIEDLYLRKVLRVLLATSTLAVGVNLPAHMVVIKGVKLYQNGESKEYSDLDIMQMMGRAGRPQFDTEGIAIIMCETELERKYRDLVQGTAPLESSLHMNLTEHLNSEIGLGTITNINTAQEWLLSSFLYHRIQKNPQHYGVGKDDHQSWRDKVHDIVMDSIEQLRGTELITYSPRDGELSSTEFGDIMSKFYIRRQTMKAILGLTQTASLREILEMIASSEELSDLKLRSGEKQIYEKIRRHNDIRFTIKKVQDTSDKVFLLIQAVLGGLSLSSAEYKNGESQPSLEAFSVFRHVTRIATAVAEVAIIKKYGAQVKHALELVRCLQAKAWEDRPIVLKQLEHIGEKSIKILAENRITSIPKLLSTSPNRLEELLNRRSPFGFEVLAAANELPKYFLSLKEVKVSPSDGKSPVGVELSVDCGILWDKRVSKGAKKRTNADMTTILTITSDLMFVDFRRIPTKVLREKKSFVVYAQLTRPSQTINVLISSDKIAGVTVTEGFKPSLSANKYPTLHTRPLTSLEMDLEGLEDVADFWDMKPDEDDESNIPVKDQPRSSLQNSSSMPKKKMAQPASCAADEVHSLKIINTSVRDNEPKKRADGKYDCNHTCKNKSTCRHMCCREGLSEPSRIPRRTNNTKPILPSGSKTLNNSSPSTGVEHQILRMLDDVPILERQKAAKRDPTLKQLNSLHAGADTNRRLQLSEGRRLKLAAPKSSNKPAPNFDIELVTLKCSQSPTPKDNLSESQSDDGLVNVSEFLGRREGVLSKADYSLDVDKPIRDDDDNESVGCTLSKTITPTRKRAHDYSGPTTALPHKDPVKRLRSDNTAHNPHSPRRESVKEPHRRKRFKTDLMLFDSPSDKDKIPAQRSSTGSQPLFLVQSLDVEADQPAHLPSNPYLQQSSDHFFDESFFDIPPGPQEAMGSSFGEHQERTSTQHQTTGTTYSSFELQTPSKHHQLQLEVQRTTNHPYPLPASTKNTSNPVAKHAQAGQEMKTSHNTVEVDAVTEFESWLESGAVDIV